MKFPKKNIFSMLFLILFFLIVLGSLGFVFKDRFLGKISKENNIVEEDTTNVTESLFSDLINEKFDETSTLKLEDSMAHAFSFLQLNRVTDPSLKPALVENEIAIEVVGEGISRTYKLLNSKNPSFEYEVGDEVQFNPKINSKNLLIKDGDTIYYSDEVTGFKIPGSLQVGDKVVFICQSPNCKDAVLSWALVFNDY